MTLRNGLAAALAAGMLAAAPASAVVISAVAGSAGNSVTDFSTTGRASFDLDLTDFGTPTTLTFVLESGDVGAPLAFNAILRNFTLTGMDHVKFLLGGTSFATLGTAAGFGGPGVVSGGGPDARIDLSPPEFLDLFVGDPVAAGGPAIDWAIATTGLAIGDSFTMRVTVPLPGSLPLLLAGLGVAAFVRGRHRA
jgi:hypothetical protein